MATPARSTRSTGSSRSASESDPVALARRLYAVTSSGKVDELEALLSADVVDHGVGGGVDTDELRGSGAVRADVLAFREAFPDVEIAVEEAFASGDGQRVAVRWRFTGTHRGAFQGIPASGRTVTMQGIDILRVEGGRIVERWGSSDELGLLQQLVDRRQGERRSPRETAEASVNRRQTGRRRTDPSLGQ